MRRIFEIEEKKSRLTFQLTTIIIGVIEEEKIKIKNRDFEKKSNLKEEIFKCVYARVGIVL